MIIMITMISLVLILGTNLKTDKEIDLNKKKIECIEDKDNQVIIEKCNKIL